MFEQRLADVFRACPAGHSQNRRQAERVSEAQRLLVWFPQW